MNFTDDMILKLSPEEKLLLTRLFEKAQDSRPSASAPEWQWTIKGPASEEQAFKARRGVPSPLLKGGKVSKEVSSLAPLTS
jgi:hypothetical protein